MSHRVEHDDSPRAGFGDYWYRIYRDDVLIARYRHDYRGDDHGIEFVDGRSQGWPVGRMTDFLEGGGPMPLTLSSRAEAYLREMFP